MLRKDCRHCGENIFEVQDITHLGAIPHEWTCSGCGRVYVAKMNKAGGLVVYQRGYPKAATVYKIPKSDPGEEPGNGDE